MLNKLEKIVKKVITRELIDYGIVGIIAVAVNIGSFWLLIKLPIFAVSNGGLLFANTIAFFLTVSFAYFTNTLIVFKNRLTLRNCVEFFTMRIATIFIDDGGLYLLLNLGTDEILAKVLINIILVLTNYLLSKFIIYKKPRTD